jgi:regulator of sirC expression with transglutaminase-like and TPR domain
MSSNEVSALISLIEDPDETIYAHVRHELISHGENVLAALEFHWQNSNHGPLFLERIEELIGTIHYDSLYRRLKNWKNQENPDLLEGALLLNRYQYPGFDESELKKEFMKVRRDIWLELNDNLTALETVHVMNHILFEVYGFKGVKTSPSNTQNSFLTDVISSKKGNALSLGVLYCSLAQSLEIPIFGVNLPNHFLLCYTDYDEWMREEGFPAEEADLLFFINPYGGGNILHPSEVEDFLRTQLMEPDAFDCRTPCSSIEMVKRMLNEMIHSYILQNKADRVSELQALLSVLLEE